MHYSLRENCANMIFNDVSLLSQQVLNGGIRRWVHPNSWGENPALWSAFICLQHIAVYLTRYGQSVWGGILKWNWIHWSSTAENIEFKDSSAVIGYFHLHHGLGSSVLLVPTPLWCHTLHDRVRCLSGLVSWKVGDMFLNHSSDMFICIKHVLTKCCFGYSCVGVEEDKAADIDLYHCPNCQVTHGPPVSK